MTISKRTGKLLSLIAAFILSVALVVSLKTYLTDSQIQISFNVSPSVTGKYRATFFFTDEQGRNIDFNNQEFIVSQDKDLTAGRFTQIEFKKLIRPHKKLQKFQLSLTYLGDPNTINNTYADIKHIQLSRSPIKQLNDSYRITFKGADATFIQANEMNLRPRYTHFAVFGILIITFIGTGIFYKLIRFVFNQKAMQQGHYADITFIFTIVVTLAIPTIGINTTPNIPEPNENRMLAEYKPFFTNDWHRPVNLTYMKDFENWFNDRFGKRNKLVAIKRNIQLALNEVIYVPNAGVCQKSNSWCFELYPGQSELDDFFGKIPVRDQDITYINKLVKGIHKQIYVLVYPLKSQIYPDKLAIVNQRSMAKLHFSDKVYAELKKINLPNLHVINVAQIFKEEKKKNPDKLLYFIDEHHVTEYGNKVVVEYLNKLLKTDKASINLEKLYSAEDLNIASGEFVTKDNSQYDFLNTMIYGISFGRVFGMNKRSRKSRYFIPHKYPMYSLSNKYKQDIHFIYDMQCDANILLHNSLAEKLKAYVIGTSFVETLSKMLATSFSDVYRRRINTDCGYSSLTPYRANKQIKQINPDVIFVTYWANGFFYVE